ncbi:MAG: hypothetical protein IT572_03775 [Deltaproteobacteria bacterium]|nr:hypothetical protein [Deltaproteobacteria bacterium]
MGYATPYARVHLPIPILRLPEGPDTLDPYPPAFELQVPVWSDFEALERLGKGLCRP